ncbi:MAG: NTP transferase domain-containing protein [Chloroflexota bacterium]
MDAVIIAGGIPQPQDALYAYSKGESKALIDVAGKPMVQWVLDALGNAKTIDRVVLIGLTDKSGLTCRKPLAYLSNEGKMLANIRAGTEKVLELNPRAGYVLFVTSDIPALTGQMVDWVVNTCLQTRHDIYYNVIPRQVMEQRFPTSRRTFVRLKDIEACGGDMHMARTAVVSKNSEFWDRLIEARKNPAAQASLLGFDIVFRFLFRQLTADDVIRRLAERLGLKGRALICPFAEVGMDVDKPHQLDIMRAHLGRGQRGRTAARITVRRAAQGAAAGKASRSAAKPSATRRRKAGSKAAPARGRSRRR